MQTAPEEQASSSAVLHAMSICHIAASSYEQACTASRSALTQLSIDTVLLPPSATAHCSNDKLQSALGCALLRCGRADLAAVEFDAVAERLQARSHTNSSSARTSSKKSSSSSVGSTSSDKVPAAAAAVDLLRARYHCSEARRQQGDWSGALQLLEAASATAVELLTSAQVYTATTLIHAMLNCYIIYIYYILYIYIYIYYLRRFSLNVYQIGAVLQKVRMVNSLNCN
jgi:hypothetical protein